MAKINKSEVLNEITKGCRIDTAIEQAPTDLAKTVVPVFVVNEQKVLKIVKDSTLNDNDKKFTVPAGKVWRILRGVMKLTTTATAGNRQIRVSFEDIDNDGTMRIDALNVQIASTAEQYNLFPGANDVSESVAGNHIIALPETSFILELEGFRIRDIADIDSNDDMTVIFYVEEFDMPANT